MAPFNPRSQRQRAFTLVELLMVVAIICLLMAILVPALNWVRVLGRRAVCTTNLGRQAKGVISYVGDHKNRFPRHREADTFAYYGSERRVVNTWFHKIEKYCPREKGFRCPEMYQGQVDGGVDWEWSFNDNIGYGYNCYFLGNYYSDRGRRPGYSSGNYHGTGPMPGKFVDTLPMSLVKDPTKCMMIADTQPKRGSATTCTFSIWWPFASGNPGPGNYNEGVNGERHYGVGPIVYCDGHTELVNDPNTTRNPPYSMSRINIEYWDPLMRTK